MNDERQIEAPETPTWAQKTQNSAELSLDEVRQKLNINKPEDIFDKEETTEAEVSKEPSFTPDTSIMSAESLFGAATPKVLEVPVIKGPVNTGCNLMVLDTTPITPNKIKPGAEMWLQFAQAVQTGTPLFGKYPAHKGNTTISVATARWQGKFKTLPVFETPKGLEVSAPLTL